MYELNSRLVAFEREERYDGQAQKEKLKGSFFILDENKKVHKVEKIELQDAYECTKTFDYSKHKMDALINNDWSQCHISSKAITYGEIVFQVNDDNPVSKSHFWFERVDSSIK